MTGPDVYRCISKVTQELAVAGISKRHTNEHEQYKYRSIDDLLNQLGPALAKHKLCVLPRVLERESAERTATVGERIGSVVLRVAFDLISSRDGSKHTIEAFGEALDDGDKGTAKAMSAAFKSVMLQAFCVPVVGVDDPDGTSPRLTPAARTHQPAPDGGWESWVEEVIEITRSCVSDAALRRVQQTHRERLKGLSRERRDLYDTVGEAFAARAAALVTCGEWPISATASHVQVPKEPRKASAGLKDPANA